MSKYSQSNQDSMEGKKSQFYLANNLYEGVKYVWVKGKDYTVLKPFLGVAEGVVSKVARFTTGSEDLGMLDKNTIKPGLEVIDKNVIDPVICKMNKTFAPIVKQREEIVRLENLYEGAKFMWMKGKHYSILKPFLGAAEDVVSKVARITTGSEDLEILDKNTIKPGLAIIDKKIIIPALGKGEKVSKSFIHLVTKNEIEKLGGE